MLQVTSNFHRVNKSLGQPKGNIGRDRWCLKISRSVITPSVAKGMLRQHGSVKRPLHKQPFDELILDMKKYIRENMLHSALRVLSEMLHRPPQDRQYICSCLVTSALGDIGYENFGLCLVVMQCLMGLTDHPVTPNLLCALIKLMCASPKTFMVSWLCDAHGTEQGRQRLRVLQPDMKEPPASASLQQLLDQRSSHALTLLSLMPITSTAEARRLFHNFDPYFSREVISMFERAFWKSHTRGRLADARLFLLTLPICVIKDARQKPLMLPAVEPCWDPCLVNKTCQRVTCAICKNK